MTAPNDAPSEGGNLRSPRKRAVHGLVARRIGKFLAGPQALRRSQFEHLGAPAEHVVLLGDSITEGGLWNEWFPHLPVLNRGISGETSTQVLSRLSSAINAPIAVLLLIGTNDLSAGRRVEEVAGTVREIRDEIAARAQGTPVLMQSVMPRSPDYAGEVRLLNSRLHELATRRPHTEYLDLWPALAGPDGALRPAFTNDRLHLNGDGYRAWVEVLRPRIEELVGSRSS